MAKIGLDVISTFFGSEATEGEEGRFQKKMMMNLWFKKLLPGWE